MKPFILDLSDPQADLETVGGKGMSLAKMRAAGLPVPGGFHVTTEAYRCFVADNGIQERIAEALSSVDATDPIKLEAVSQAIASYFVQGQIPTEIRKAIAAAYTTMQNTPVAVRSSATAEDLPDASFAGQQETYLNIHGESAVLEAVKKCWASLWTARAIAYRLKNQIDQNTVALAVVIQELVFADAAGILFTANPNNGCRGELVINAAWGLGEAVVSGVVTPDTIIVNKENWKILHHEISEKKIMTVRTESGTHEQPVPESGQKKAVLNTSQVRELARLGTRIEQFYGRPMDVEWAITGGQFAIVQARPITALPLEWKVPEGQVIYARGSLAEHTPSPVTPLFATLGLEIANAATADMWERVIGKDAKYLIAAEGFYQAFNGYVYGGVRMGLKDIIGITKMSFSQMGPMFHGSVERWQSAHHEFAEVVKAWEAKPLEPLSPLELLEGIRTVFWAACHFFTQIQTCLPAASTSEISFTRFYTSLIRRKQDPEAAVFLLGSETTVLRSEKSLFDLAQWTKTLPVLADYCLHTPTQDLLGQLSQAQSPALLPVDAWQEFRQRFHSHIESFGRTSYEFDFSIPTPLEDPAPILNAFKNFLTGKVVSPYERQRESIARREQATQAVLARVGWPRRGWFQKLLGWAQSTGQMREDSIFDMGMAHPLLRRMFGELARRLVAARALNQPNEIYWLEKHELEELAAGLQAGSLLPNLSERIPERQSMWQVYLKTTPPVMLPERTGWSKFIHGGEAAHKDGKTMLKGVGTSAGKITAPACVLFGPEDFGKIKPGDVLVAVTTTPAWTPLFATASAVVTDIGGPLSHSSIVAREYGIPAVMATRSGTRAIRSGQIITVDGSAGTVTLEQP